MEAPSPSSVSVVPGPDSVSEHEQLLEVFTAWKMLPREVVVCTCGRQGDVSKFDDEGPWANPTLKLIWTCDQCSSMAEVLAEDMPTVGVKEVHLINALGNRIAADFEESRPLPSIEHRLQMLSEILGPHLDKADDPGQQLRSMASGLALPNTVDAVHPDSSSSSK